MNTPTTHVSDADENGDDIESDPNVETGAAAAEDAELEDAQLEDAESEDAELEDAELEDAELEDEESTGEFAVVTRPVREPVSIEVCRRGALAAGVAVVAALVGVAYLGRALSTGAPVDWVLAVALLGLGAANARSWRDARVPLMVADLTGIRVRLGRTWQGLPWEEIEEIEHAPRRGLLRDGRLVAFPIDAAAVVEGLDPVATAQAKVTEQVHGAPFAVPLGLTTRVIGADGGLTAALLALVPDPDMVVEVVPGAPEPQVQAESESESEREPEAEPEPEPERDAPSGAAFHADFQAELQLEMEAARAAFRAEIEAQEGGSAYDEYEDEEPAGVYDAQTDPAAREDFLHEDVEPEDLENTASHDAVPAEPEPEPEPIVPVAATTTPDPERAVLAPRRSEVTRVVTAPPVPTGLDPVALDDLDQTRIRPRPTGAGAPEPAGLAGVVDLRREARDYFADDPDDTGIDSDSALWNSSTVVFDEQAEPAREPVIGPVLADARIALGLGVDRLAERTRIRPHVIEAIEVDDFEPCGGDFYARGHLRTLARVLGIDAGPLLATYDERYVEAPFDARKVFEAELAGSSAGAIRPLRGGPNWSMLVAVVMAVVLAWSVARLVVDRPDAVDDSPSLAGDSAGLSSAQTALTEPVPVVLTAQGGGARVVVRDGEGAVVFKGNLAFGRSKTVQAAAPVRVQTSDGSLTVGIDGAEPKRMGRTGESARATFVPES